MMFGRGAATATGVRPAVASTPRIAATKTAGR